MTIGKRFGFALVLFLATAHPSHSQNSTAIDGDLEQQEVAALTALPAGVIIMWNRAVVPDGWAVCDGHNGTPNLTDRFVKATVRNNIGRHGEPSGTAKVIAATALGKGDADTWHINTHSSERNDEPSVTGRNHTHEVLGSATIDAVEPKSALLVFIMRCRGKCPSKPLEKAD